MIEDLAARQRSEAAAAIQRRAKRQGDAAFWDGQGATDSGGNSIPVTTGSNGPLRLGQSAPLLRGGGSAQIDAFSAMRSDEPLIPLPPKGNIKVCLKVSLETGDIQYWLGGDRSRPTLIHTILAGSETALEAEFEATGPNKSDWIFALKTEVNGVLRLRTFSGGGITIDSGPNPKVAALSYKGAKFWASESIAPLFVANPNHDSVPGIALYGYFFYSMLAPGTASRAARVALGGNGTVNYTTNVFPRIAQDFTPFGDAYPLTLEFQGSGSYGFAETTQGLMPESAFLALFYGNSNFSFISGSSLSDYSSGFTEGFTANAVAVSFFSALQEDGTGTDRYGLVTNYSGAISSQFVVDRYYPNNEYSFGVNAEFFVQSNPINPPPLMAGLTVSGSPSFSNTTQEITTTSRIGTYPIYLSPTVKLENSVEYDSQFTAYIADFGSSIIPTRITTAQTRKTYRSLKTYDAALSVFYSYEEAQGDAANITGFRYDQRVPTELPSQTTTSFFVKTGSAAPLLLAAPPAEPYNDYTWVKSASELQLYKVDRQPFLTDSQGNAAIAILQADIRAEVAQQNLVSDAFVPATDPIQAKALKMRVQGATNQNTTILRAHYWPQPR
jgi:hypothetical protein